MYTGIGIIVAGFILAFVMFAFAALNMARHVTSAEFGEHDTFARMFKRHAAATIGMAFSGLLVVVGVVVIVISLAQHAGL